MDALRQDLRHALRRCAREPFFHLAVVLTLALGIGANTAIFSVVNAVLFDALPYPDADRLVRVWNRNDERALLRRDAALQDVRDWRERTGVFQALAVFNPRSANLASADGADRIDYALVSPDFFRAFGVAPLRGRDFADQDNVPGHDHVAIVSHAFWRDRLGGDAAALGRTVQLDGVPTTVIGVMPAGFGFPQRSTALWKPFGMGPDDGGERGGRWVSVIGRLRSGVSPAHANRELETVARATAAEFPDTNRGWSTWIEPLQTTLTGNVRTPLLLIWATVGLVLLIACANVTNLLLARSIGRRRELAVRRALGAPRRRLIAQWLVESGVLAFLGGLLGVGLAWPALALVARLGETALAAGPPPRLDGRVLAFTFLISVVTGVLTGLIPSIVAAARASTSWLRAGRAEIGHSQRLRSALVGTEIALATTVLVGAGLLVRSLAALRDEPVGVSLENRITFRIAPPWTDGPQHAQADLIYRALEEKIRAVPGVIAVGSVNRMPLEGNWWSGDLTERGRPAATPADRLSVLNRVVTPGFFQAAGIRLLRGRLPDANDAANSARVIAVSETVARRLWNGRDPIGSNVTNEDPADTTSAWYTVVGIVSDVRYAALDSEPSAVTYTTLAQARWGHFGDWGMGVVVLTAGEPSALVPALRTAVIEVDPGLPIFQIGTFRDRIEGTLSARRQTTNMLLAFALLALALAALGTYAVLAFTVSRQVPELGLRMALGASAWSVTALVLQRGLRPAVAGVLAGLLAAGALAPLLGQLLFGVRPLDAVTLVVVSGTLLLVATAACLIPAWRAGRLQPRVALSTD
jgi:predicted permease